MLFLMFQNTTTLIAIIVWSETWIPYIQVSKMKEKLSSQNAKRRQKGGQIRCTLSIWFTVQHLLRMGVVHVC